MVVASLAVTGCSKPKKPLKCPSGTERIGSGPPTGKREYCAKLHKKSGEMRKHGPWRAFWPNGKVESTRVYKKGKEHGLYRGYNLEGRKILEGKYQKGVKVGTWSKFKRSGDLEKETDYEDGQKAVIRLYDDAGKVVEEQFKRNGEWFNR